ncbi:hypothetical protein DVH24_002276 [Malus domestica]|uniref:Uncharacterized protein n=1 Tax=Malus domestica TaxID=3750 RepID=A0A498I4U2_MALDO|nr:hypothetical protein DVH24_002276 [Malus domestica]
MKQLGKLGYRAQVLNIAQGTERSGSRLEPRRNRGLWVGSNSSVDEFKGWSGSNNGKESLDLVRGERAAVAMLDVREEPKRGRASESSNAGEGDEGEKREGVGDEGEGWEARLEREKSGGDGLRGRWGGFYDF